MTILPTLPFACQGCSEPLSVSTDKLRGAVQPVEVVCPKCGAKHKVNPEASRDGLASVDRLDKALDALKKLGK